MKQVIFMLWVVCALSLWAGDLPETIMEGNQQAVFIGQIKAMSIDYCEVVPITIMMGEIREIPLWVSPIKAYYGIEEKPEVGDYIVAVLKEDNEIDQEWLFKADTSDYKSLNLISRRDESVERYETYIHEGKYFEAQKKLSAQAPDTVKIEEKQQIKGAYVTIIGLSSVLITSLILYQKHCKKH